MADETTPTPDPTILTTEQLERAIEGVRRATAALKELMEAGLAAQEQICNEKFNSVDKQFGLVERQRVEQKEDTKAAVDAAFSAAKEAVREQTNASDKAIAKSETSMLEQLKQMGATFTTAIKGTEDSIGDVKERVSKIESFKQGGKETLVGLYALVGTLLAIAGLIATAYIATH